MLILTRRIGETVMIGEDIAVTIIGQTGQQVRVGIAAPREVAVHREEIFRRIHGEEATNDLLEDTPVITANKPRTAGQQKKSKPAIVISEIKYGNISSLPKDKPYGFIYTPGMEKAIFFHASNIADFEYEELYEGMEVKFKLMYEEKGYYADDISVIS